MASEVDWDSVANNAQKGKGTTKGKYVKFQDGTVKIIRPLGKAVMFYKFFENDRSIVVDPEYKSEAAAKLSAHFGKEIRPTLRYAINVIDREDQQIRILEGGSTIFDQFANWSQGSGVKPGSDAGWDWRIAASGKGLNRKYVCSPIKPMPFTSEETHRIKDLKEHYTLKEEYKGTPLDEVVAAMTNDKSSGPEPVGSVVNAEDDDYSF